MAEQQGLHIINGLRQRWIIYQLLIHCLIALGAAMLLSHVLHAVWLTPMWWLLVLFAITLAGLIWWRNPWKIDDTSVTRYLNREYPELEESSQLILQPSGHLNLLEKLQRHKVESTLQTLPARPNPFARPLIYTFIAFIIAIVLSLVAVHTLHPPLNKQAAQPSSIATCKTAPKEHILPQIDRVSITITPPAYTGKPVRQQTRFTLLVEDGASVRWQIETNVATKQMVLILNGKEKLKLHSANASQTAFAAQALIKNSGFYQIDIDGKLSDLYQIQVTKDNLPAIHIKTPKQYTYIDAGESPKVIMNAQVSDDYGIADALLVATVAKGSGEAVKFKEYKIPFANIFNGHQQQYSLQKLLDLPALNMEPGDELYFYLQARDTHQQQTRTDVYIVSIQDTAALLSMDGIVAASNIKPEFFRSERQIILDTEGLLKAKDSISADNFKNRCNDIAADQKLLRLRYGKFLGEEDESKVGQAEEGNDLAKTENFNNVEKIMDAYTDKHDNAEDATFLEPAVKAQLRATLNEMWKAELQLRLYKPHDALPFEYKALRLLKDLQQKSRSYAAKTLYNPPPLKPEKRLSGDLSKITNPVNQQNGKAVIDEAASLKNAIAVLEQVRSSRTISITDKRYLQSISQQLNARAAAQPGIYLSAVSALRRVLNEPAPQMADINVVEGALQKMLPAAKNTPHATASTTDMGLSQSYFQKLNRSNR